MPEAKTEFETLYPCHFYEPADLLDPELMYTVPEIARLLQGLEPDESLERGEEEVLVDWAIPWIVDNAEALAVAEPREDVEPGYYGLREE